MVKTTTNKNLVIIVLILIILVNFTCCLQDDEKNNDKNHEKDDDDISDLALKEFIEKVENVTASTLVWAESLDVDPVKLRQEMGIKGKKKYVELLDIYFGLYETTDEPLKKEEYRKTVEELANFTKDPNYHDLNEINDTQFREDSTSYLRAWYILNEFGLNTTYYLTEIEKILPRLNDHLPSRGINQKMAFVFYYHKLGYEIEYTMENLFNNSVIRSRILPENLSELRIYHITHEIFFLYEEHLMDILSNDDINYLKNVLRYQVNFTISENNVDLLAELIMIMHYLDFFELEEYEIALNYLFSSQNKNGTFGDYEYVRNYFKEIGSPIDVDIYLYLHTTEVSIRALNEAVYFKKNNSAG